MSSRFLPVGAVLLICIAGFFGRLSYAEGADDPRGAAVAAMQTWLLGIDQGDYPGSWKGAAGSFQKAVTSDQWTAALNSVRKPLGKCIERKLASSLHQTEVPGPAGPQKGDYVVAQFNTSFENLAYAVETVCFERGSDGAWKASGYYIKPK